MKRRSFPIWLLRDVQAFLGIMLSFWPLILCVINSGAKAMRDSKVSQRVYDRIALLLAHAEARLDFALWRQAYRRLGWDPRRVALNPIEPAASRTETHQRIRAYVHAFRDMHAVVDAYVEHLRLQYRLDASALAAHGSTDARQSRAAHHELVGVGALFSSAATVALILSSARRARPSKDERGHGHARGPPLPALQVPKSKGRALQDDLLRERGLVSFVW